jgi:uncharacterized protein (DUF1330 family)
VAIAATHIVGVLTNVDAYTKEFVPLARASIRNSGGKPVAASQKVVALEGTAPSSRITINVFDSLEKAQAWRNGTEYKEARKIGDKRCSIQADRQALPSGSQAERPVQGSRRQEHGAADAGGPRA